jgi:predicted ATP-grasp superfamily ATP-dependent carboligase
MKAVIEKEQFPPAVLVGLDSLQGLQTARILAGRQIPVIALARDPHHYGCRTNVCQQIIHTDTESEQLIRTLEKLGPTLPQKAVLFPCEDANVLLVSRHRERLTPWYHMALPAPGTVEMLLDKASFYRFAQEHGFPVPRSFHVHSRAEVEQAAQELTFPCILKPPMSATPEWEHNTSLKAFKVGDAAELLAIYERFRRWSASFVVQEWIDGPETNHYTCNCYFSANAEPLVTFTTQKIRQWPPRTGQACLGVECRNEAVRAETVRFFQQLNFHGLAYLEMKQDSRTGRYFIIEPNIGRPTGRSATAEASGVELLYTMYCEALGRPLPPNRQQRYTGVKWIYLRQDFQAALYHWRQGTLTLAEWWRSWQGLKADALFSWRDPAPFIADGLRVAQVSLSAAERQKRNYAKPLLGTR